MQAVIFDCDGVLIDSEAIYIDAELEFLARAGVPFERGAYVQTFTGLAPGEWRTRLGAQMQARAGRPPGAGFFRSLDAYVMRAFEAGLIALPGARDAVANVRALRCVASSTPLERLTWKLRRTGLLDLFTPHLFSADMVTRGKPAPDLFVHAANTLGVDPRHCIVVEDSVNGIRAARAAGMGAIGFTAGTHCLDGHATDLQVNGADVVIDAFADLRAAIEAVSKDRIYD